MHGYSPTQQQATAYPFPGYGYYPGQPNPYAPQLTAQHSSGSSPWPPEMQQAQANPWPIAFPVPGPGSPTHYVAPYIAPTPQAGHDGLPAPQPGKMPRPKNIHRSGTLLNVVPIQPQLKSALRKRKGSVSAHGHGHSHSFSDGAVMTQSSHMASVARAAASTAGHTPMVRTPSLPSTPRSRTNSTAHHAAHTSHVGTPDHIFVSFHSANELRVDNLDPKKGIAEALMELVLPLWHYRATPDTSRRHRFMAHFEHHPWAATGDDAILAYRMICRLFAVFALNGYFYLTSVDVANALKPPRLVFVGSRPDPTAHFFVMTLSRVGHKMMLIDPPPAVGETIGLRLRAAFAKELRNEGFRGAENIYVAELKRGMFGEPEVDKTVFVGWVLKYIKQLGYKLDASVPMARSGVLGLGGRKEIWIFKGPPQRRMSIE